MIAAIQRNRHILRAVAPMPQSQLLERLDIGPVLDLNARHCTAFFHGTGSLPSSLLERLGSIDVVLSYLSDPHDSVRRVAEQTLDARYVNGPYRLDHGNRHATEQLAGPLEQLGVPLVDPVPRLPRRSGRAQLRRLAFHPGSGSPRKNLPLATWSEFLEEAQHQFDEIIMVLGEAERPEIQAEFRRFRSIRFLVCAPILEVAQTLENCSLYVGHDTGITHLAAALGIATVTLFGPTDPRIWRPLGPHVELVQSAGHEMAAIKAPRILEACQKLQRRTGP